jgi:hypothetical protein
MMSINFTGGRWFRTIFRRVDLLRAFGRGTKAEDGPFYPLP